eukprot:g24950.t1
MSSYLRFCALRGIFDVSAQKLSAFDRFCGRMICGSAFFFPKQEVEQQTARCHLLKPTEENGRNYSGTPAARSIMTQQDSDVATDCTAAASYDELVLLEASVMED